MRRGEVVVGRKLAAGVWRELALVLRREAVCRRGVDSGGHLIRAGDKHADRTETLAQREALLDGLLQLHARRARLALDAIAVVAHTFEVGERLVPINECLLARTFCSAGQRTRRRGAHEGPRLRA